MLRYLIFLISIASGFLVWILLSQANKAVETQANSENFAMLTSEVLVYSGDFERGKEATNDMFTWQTRLNAGLTDDAVIKSEQSIGRLQGVLEGESMNKIVQRLDLVRWSDFGASSGQFLSNSIDKNMRAVGIRISTEKLAGGFILPNDIVDVVLTIQRDLDGDGFANATSIPILSNVRVLAVGLDSTDKKLDNSDGLLATQENKTNKTALGDTVTLQLSESQALILTAAAQSGQLSLLLKREADAKSTEIGAVSVFMENIDLRQMTGSNTNFTEQDPEDNLTIGEQQQRRPKLNVLQGTQLVEYEFD